MPTTNTYDVIVIGSGLSGGWAAKEFTEKGLKTLVLERGKEVKHLKDYPTTNKMPWEFPHRNELTQEIKDANPVISKCYAFREDAMHFFVKDAEHPYVQEKPFDWIRGYQTGGKSLMWARQDKDGVHMILKVQRVMALQSIGLYVIKTWRLGTAMLKNLQVFLVTAIILPFYPMENFYLHWK